MEHLLRDAAPENEFILGQRRIKNLYELVSVLNEISDIEFNYYSNDSKNDFSRWVKEVIKDETLAEDLVDCHTREETINCVESRIEWIEYEIENGAQVKEDPAWEKETFRKIPELEPLKPLDSFESLEKEKIKKEEQRKEHHTRIRFSFREFFIGLLIGLFFGIVIAKLLSYFNYL